MTPMQRMALRARFSLEQAARIGWYANQNAAGARLATRVSKSLPRTPPPTIKAPGGIPERPILLRHVRALLAKDLENVEAGLYPLPRDEPDGLPGLFKQRRLYLDDVPNVVRRRATASHQEIDRTDAARPRYYLQNFHFQTDGWLSDTSAALYETQVETLFLGAAAAMRRQALIPIAERAAQQDQRTLRLLDVASGSGAFVRELSRAFPRLPVMASDLSPHYLSRAARFLSRAPGSGALVAAAEQLPIKDASLDLVTNIYLFHELPPKIRKDVASEFARVLAPGGQAIVVDSLQTGDTPELDGLLELFPQLFHEPYYSSYLTTDFPKLFNDAGLVLEDCWPAFVSKVYVFRKL
ncbi:MAG: class I SAM-dependent methyltransferase [Pseudomonadota bacterium]